MEEIRIDKQKIVGTIKPMHCVNNLPQTGEGLDAAFGELNIPYSRLHDTVFLNSHFVDVHAIFPDFGRDENDPDAYDFAFTDWLIARLQKAGTRAFYRLGESIENYQAVKAYYIYPPADYGKWARVCEHIVAHYNEGWKDGFRMGIEYWEIWNEPDNYPDIADNQMWKGTFEEFLSFYETVSNHLKKRFPDIKIGGYGSCGFYAILKQRSAEQANVSDRTDYFVDCFERFLKYVSSEEHRSPLDFFSWHSYSDVHANVAYARYAREMLDRYGFPRAESILNEYNPGIALKGTLRDASNICANMLALQKQPLDMLMYYDCAAASDYCGLFEPITKRPFAAYYVFQSFSRLYRLKNMTETGETKDGLFAVSAFDGKRGAALVTNNAEREREVRFTGVETERVLSVADSEKPVEVSLSDGRYALRPFEILLVEYR